MKFESMQGNSDLKGTVQPKIFKFCHDFLTLKLFQICINFFVAKEMEKDLEECL